MTSHYKKLVEAVGEDKAREHMRDVRSKVKNPYHHFQTLDKDQRSENAKKAAKARWGEKKDTEEQS